MKPVQGIVTSGRIDLSQPIDWPEGTIVCIQPVRSEVICLEEEPFDVETKQGDDPESVARWLAEFDAIPPLEMTSEEESKWRTARDDQHNLELELQDDRLDQLRRTLP